MIKILIVDDEVDIETLITQKFRRKVRREEWQMTFSRNGEEALKALKGKPGNRHRSLRYQYAENGRTHLASKNPRRRF